MGGIERAYGRGRFVNISDFFSVGEYMPMMEGEEVDLDLINDYHRR
jgi:hypothetical protein